MVEVSYTTLAYDRNVKLALYAHAGLPKVWTLGPLRGEVVTSYSGPERGGYKNDHEHRHRGDEMSSSTVPGLTLTIDEVLGR